MFSQNKLKMHSMNANQKIKNSKKNINYFTKPYKHLVVDNFFDTKLINQCLKNFPNLLDKSWEFTNDKDIEVKYRSKWSSEFDIPEGIIDAIRIMNGADFLKSVSEIFKIKKLVPDPYFTGGGLNVTKNGGLLDVHVDGNYHDATGLNRRLNALLFLNKKWTASWGGEFGLYDNKGEVCLKKIEPIFNRLVVFDTHDTSWHGLPDPINFPEKNPRRSILLYYYTKEKRSRSQIKISHPHSALWKRRGEKDKKGKKIRNFD
jgi:Rps23 Pro-64 3,4-dihydroxylase Tpa1-like proline 4-hydroxylase|tara:strand:+ start:1125 stop:1904 length:780 start_codon:yes stop_codon:yes gene_type:complete